MNKIEIPGVGVVKPIGKNQKVFLNVSREQLEKIAAIHSLSVQSTEILLDLVVNKVSVIKVSEKYNVSRTWVYVLKKKFIKYLNEYESGRSSVASSIKPFEESEFPIRIFPATLNQINVLLLANQDKPHPNEYRNGMKDAMNAYEKNELTSPLKCKEGGETKMQRHRHGYNDVFKIING